MKRNRISIFVGFNHGVDIVLDTLLNKILDSNRITDYIEERCHFTIEFEDGTTVKAWNNNKWYAWMCIGEIKISDNKNTCNYTYKWNDKRPKRKTMNRMLAALDSFKIDKFISIIDKNHNITD